MGERKSLMEQAGIGDEAASAAPSSRGSSPQAIKLVVVVVLALAATGVLAWSLGLFGGKGAPKVDPKLAEERRERFDQEVKAEKAREEKLGITPVESGG